MGNIRCCAVPDKIRLAIGRVLHVLAEIHKVDDPELRQADRWNQRADVAARSVAIELLLCVFESVELLRRAVNIL